MTLSAGDRLGRYEILEPLWDYPRFQGLIRSKA